MKFKKRRDLCDRDELTLEQAVHNPEKLSLWQLAECSRYALETRRIDVFNFLQTHYQSQLAIELERLAAREYTLDRIFNKRAASE